MKKLTTLAAATLALSLTAATTHASNSAVASNAMQCYTMYNLMMEKNPSDPYRNNVLNSQSSLMGTIYVMNAGTVLKPVSKDDFDKSHAFAQQALLAMGKHDRASFVQKLVNCEGWREEVLTSLALGIENVPEEASMDVAQEILSSIPAPKTEYPLKGATYEQLDQLAQEALSQHP